jgi:hypothetical protein
LTAEKSRITAFNVGRVSGVVSPDLLAGIGSFHGRS